MGPATELLPTLPAGAEIVDHRPHLIMPGFIDAHLHMPQTQVIASCGAAADGVAEQIHVRGGTEARPAGPCPRSCHASCSTSCWRHGTTTAAVYCSVHPQSAEAFFVEIRAPQHPHDRRQGDDGPPRPGGPDRYGRERLCRQQGADRALARQGQAALCDHPALRRDLDAGADAALRAARGRAPGLLCPDPYQREPGRDHFRA